MAVWPIGAKLLWSRSTVPPAVQEAQTPAALGRCLGALSDLGGEVAAGQSVAAVRADDDTSQLEQGEAAEDGRHRFAEHRDELVHRCRTGPDGPDHGSLDRTELDFGRAPRTVRRRPEETEVLDEGRDVGDDLGDADMVAEEGEAAGGHGGAERARHEMAVASLLERPAGRDEGSAPQGRLDDDRRIGESTDQAVASRERPPAGFDVGGDLGDHAAAALDDGCRKPFVGPRREMRMAPAEDGDGRSGGGHGSGMSRPVDADREPRHDGRARIGDRHPDPGGDATTVFGGPSRPDDGDSSRPREGLDGTAHEEQVRRHLDLEQPSRIGGVLERHHRQAEFANAGDEGRATPPRLGDAAGDGRVDRSIRAVPFRDPGETPRRASSREYRAAVAEAPEQRAETDRPESLDRGEDDPGVAFLLAVPPTDRRARGGLLPRLVDLSRAVRASDPSADGPVGADAEHQTAIRRWSVRSGDR